MAASLSGPTLVPRAGGPPRQLVVLLHGVGADGSDLIALAPALGEALPHAAFIAPDAPQPCDMAPFGRQWFSLQDVHPAAMLLGPETAARTLAVMRRRAEATAPMLNAFLDDQLARHGLEERQLALVGFSQGTMMALYVAPRRPRPCAAVVGYSGALLGAETLPTEARSRPPVLLIHGDADEIVPVQALDLAVRGLQDAEIPVRWRVRPGLPHAVDPEGIQCGADFLRAAFEETSG